MPPIPPSDPAGRQGRTAPFVVLSDLLPGRRAESDATIGVNGVVDDPVTTALAAATGRLGGVWIGRPQDPTPERSQPSLRGLDLDPGVADGYARHANSTIWPLYHDLVRPAEHDPRWREAYRAVNYAFAAAAAREAAVGASVWVHDYHLHLVPSMLRRLRPDLRIGFYLSTMFPPADILQQTPMHRDMLAGLLGADVIGFQAANAAENFLRLSETLPQDTAAMVGSLPPPVDVGVYPTSVDARVIEQLARRPDVVRRAAAIRDSLGSPPVVVLSIDAATEAAGIERRLRVIHDLFDSGELHPEDVVVVQVVTDAPAGVAPDSDATPDVAEAIAQEAARINGRFASIGRACVHYVRDSPDLDDRVALYLAADVLVATPLREGATLPALEFVAVGARDSSLVLSEFSGTAVVLPEAFLVNPYDEDRLRRSLLAAITAGPTERERRMSAMRNYVHSYDTHAWARLFLLALQAHDHDESTSEWVDDAGPVLPDGLARPAPSPIGRASLRPGPAPPDGRVRLPGGSMTLAGGQRSSSGGTRPMPTSHRRTDPNGRIAAPGQASGSARGLR